MDKTSVCMAYYNHGFSMDLGDHGGLQVPSSSTKRQYLQLCEANLIDIERNDALNHYKDKHWTPSEIKQIANYAKRYHLKMRLLGPWSSSRVGFTVLSCNQKTLFVSMTAATDNSEELTYVLEHERGHLQDNERLNNELLNARQFAMSKSLFGQETFTRN